MLRMKLNPTKRIDDLESTGGRREFEGTEEFYIRLRGTKGVHRYEKEHAPGTSLTRAFGLTQS